jgi:hypothetical protein
MSFKEELTSEIWTSSSNTTHPMPPKRKISTRHPHHSHGCVLENPANGNTVMCVVKLLLENGVRITPT